VTNLGPSPRPRSVLPAIPKGDVLGTYETYGEAQEVVDKLAKSDFDVSQLSIIGSDLKTIERVTGKLSYGRSAITGAASGAWLGIFAGTLLFLFTSSPNLPYAFAVVLIGAAFGMLFGLVSYGFNRRRRDYSSTSQVIATSYQVIAPSDVVSRAQELLQRPESP
jgi:hypothetical protein